MKSLPGFFLFVAEVKLRNDAEPVRMISFQFPAIWENLAGFPQPTWIRIRVNWKEHISTELQVSTFSRHNSSMHFTHAKMGEEGYHLRPMSQVKMGKMGYMC